MLTHFFIYLNHFYSFWHVYMFNLAGACVCSEETKSVCGMLPRPQQSFQDTGSMFFITGTVRARAHLGPAQLGPGPLSLHQLVGAGGAPVLGGGMSGFK